MIDPARLYHIGVVVPDLDRAIDELGTAMGYTWSSIRSMSLDFAVRLAQACPILDYGAQIEVRPIADLCRPMAEVKEQANP